MKTSIKNLLLLLLLLGLPGMVQAQNAYSTNADGSIYTYSTNADGSANIVAYTGPPWVVTIPTNINGLTVTSIGDLASMTSVTIPDSVTSIADQAFDRCYKLTNVVIPNSVTSIGVSAFDNCTSMTSLTIPGSVTSIGEEAFFATGLTNLTIPGSVITIGMGAFAFCSLSSVTIPASVTNLGQLVFIGGYRMKAINVAPGNKYYSSASGVLFDQRRATLLECPDGVAGNYTVPSGVTNIAYEAFWSCGGLTGLTIPSSVITIASGAFAGCGLTNFTLANGVTSIGSQAFQNCAALTNITIPATVTNISADAFQYCSNLTRIFFEGNAPAADATVFLDDGTDATAYYLPDTKGWSSTLGGIPAVLWIAGSLQVTIMPETAITAGAEWQVDGGKWQSSGVTVTNLEVSDHVVSFNTLRGWRSPTNQTVVVSKMTTTTATGTYIAIGSVQMTLGPAAAIAGGAQWQVDYGTWQNSGATVTNLPVGDHAISFKGIDYWGTPVNQAIAIKAKTVTKATGTYTFNGAGIYNGLFMQPVVTLGTAGMLQNLTVTKSGTFTGKLLLGATTTSIIGNFDDSGHATNLLKPAKLGLVTLTMQNNWNQSPFTISGTVSGTNGGSWTANLTAELAASGLPSADFTALMGVPAGAAGSPPGYGYLLLTNHAGAAVLGGALADGTAFSQAVPLSGMWSNAVIGGLGFNSVTPLLPNLGPVLVPGDLPIYASLYGNMGLLIGWLNLESGAPAGSLAWIKEGSHFSAYYTNGFTNQMVTLQGSTWTTPPAKTAAITVPAGVLDISGGLLPAPLQFNVGVSNNNTLVNLKSPGSPTNSLTGTISTVNPARGLLTVTFGNGTGKATTIGKGAVLQNVNSAGGYFLGKTNAGVILLQP